MDALKPQRNEPARMEKLAKLPVFWGLEGKRVVLAGGSDGAAWKAELLLACGAELASLLRGKRAFGKHSRRSSQKARC